MYEWYICHHSGFLFSDAEWCGDMCTYNVLVSLADDFCTLCLYFHLNIFANIEGMFSEKA